MFGKKLRLRKIIDKHQDYFSHVVYDSQDDSPPPPQPIEYDINDENNRALDINCDEFEKLFYGFIRETMHSKSSETKPTNNTHITYPNIKKLIIRCCCSFYNNPYFENLTFDRFNTIYSDVLYRQILRSKYGKNEKCHHVFSCSQGFYHGFHKWKIKYIEDNEEISYGAIGIVSSNKCLNKAQKVESNMKLLQWTNSKVFKYTYYWCQASKCIYHYNKGKGSVLCKGIESWKKEDVITVVLDFYTFTVTFLKNGICVHKNVDLSLQKGCKYYPVIAYYHYADTYRVITQ